MGKWWSVGLKCPHCGIENTHVVSKSMEMEGKSQRVMCWNSDMQQGCKQTFDVTLSFKVTIQKVKFEGTVAELERAVQK